MAAAARWAQSLHPAVAQKSFTCNFPPLKPHFKIFKPNHVTCAVCKDRCAIVDHVILATDRDKSVFSFDSMTANKPV